MMAHPEIRTIVLLLLSAKVQVPGNGGGSGTHQVFEFIGLADDNALNLKSAKGLPVFGPPFSDALPGEDFHRM